MSYFTLLLILCYCNSQWKLLFISMRNTYESPILYLVVVVSSDIVRSTSVIKFLQNWQRFSFFQSPHFHKCIFILFFQDIFETEPKSKEIIFLMHFHICTYFISFFFSDWTILWYEKSALNCWVHCNDYSSLLENKLSSQTSGNSSGV